MFSEEPPPIPTWPAAEVSPVLARPKPPTGRVRLEIEPAGSHQLYVDGYYMGTLTDLNGEVEVEPGAHAIEVRAIGYETLRVDLKIVSDRSITYRGVLKSTAVAPPAPAAPSAASTPTTIYAIPGCYIGNVHPKDAGLPASCDMSRMTTIRQ
jgi:hypothetical protein